MAHATRLEGLESLSELFGEGTLGTLVVSSAWPLVLFAASPVGGVGGLGRTAVLRSACTWTCRRRSGRWNTDAELLLRFRGLCGIRAKKTVFQRCAIEAADDGLHLLAIGSFNKREALRFLCFGVPDYLYAIRN